MSGTILGNAYVRVRPSTEGFGSALNSGISGALKKAAGLAAAAFAASGVNNFLKDSVKLASDAEQSIGGVQAVFKNYADTVLKSSKQADRALGLSGNSYRELATLIGSQLKNAGTPMDQLGKKTDGLIKMGADLSAMYGGTTAEAVDALSAALKGEMDPIEKYGISLNDTALKAEAASLGLDVMGGTLTNSQRAMAVMSLVTKQGADAVGAFSRESDTAAGRQQRAAAQWENLKTAIGDKLLPVFSKLMDFVGTTVLPKLEQLGGFLSRDVVPAFRETVNWIKQNSDWLLPLAAAVGTFTLAMKAANAVQATYKAAMQAYAIWTYSNAAATGVFTTAMNALKVAFLSNPIGIVIAALAALGVAFVLLWKHSETFRDIVMGALHAVADAGKWMWESVLKPVFSALSTAWTAVVTAMQWAWNSILKPVWDAVAAAATWLWNNVLSVYFGLIRAEWTAVLTAVQWAWQNILSPVWNAVATAAGWLWNSVLSPVFGAIGSAWNGLATGFQWVYTNLIKPIFDAFGGLVETLKSGFQAGVDFITRVWSGLQDALMKPVQWVIDFVWNNGLRKLWNFISQIWGAKPMDEFHLAAAQGAVVPDHIGRAFAGGGVLPGYSPGRDIHRFVSPTGGILNLSGGEAILRPEFTKAVGVGGVNALNKAARNGGARGVAEALGTQSFARGGVLDLPGWLGTALHFIPGGGLISDVVNAINGGDGYGPGPWGDLLWNAVKSAGGHVWDAIKSLWSSDSDSGGGGGTGRPGVGSDAIKAFIRSVDPLPYVWGATGPNSYDCSGLAGQIYAMVTGRPWYRRYFTTGSIGNGSQLGFKPGLGGMLNLGFNSHHVVGEYGGLGFEARSTADGILTGAAATPPSRMPRQMHLALGGVLGSPAMRQLVKAGVAVAGDPSAPWFGDPRRNPTLYDNGGILPNGLSVVANATGKPEAVLTNDQWSTLKKAATEGGNTYNFNVTVDPSKGHVGDQLDAAMFELRKVKLGGRLP